MPQRKPPTMTVGTAHQPMDTRYPCGNEPVHQPRITIAVTAAAATRSPLKVACTRRSLQDSHTTAATASSSSVRLDAASPIGAQRLTASQQASRNTRPSASHPGGSAAAYSSKRRYASPKASSRPRCVSAISSTRSVSVIGTVSGRRVRAGRTAVFRNRTACGGVRVTAPRHSTGNRARTCRRYRLGTNRSGGPFRQSTSDIEGARRYLPPPLAAVPDTQHEGHGRPDRRVEKARPDDAVKHAESKEECGTGHPGPEHTADRHLERRAPRDRLDPIAEEAAASVRSPCDATGPHGWRPPPARRQQCRLDFFDRRSAERRSESHEEVDGDGYGAGASRYRLLCQDRQVAAHRRREHFRFVRASP